MAKKTTKNKTSNTKQSSSGNIIITALVFFLIGVWVGDGGVQNIDGKISLSMPKIPQFLSSQSQAASEAISSEKPAITKPLIPILKSGYGDCVVSEVVSVYDGDTFRCNIDGLSEIIGKNISVRIRGIDTPEMTDKNPYIKAKAIDARDFTKRKLLSAEVVELKNVDRDKYFRILADVYVDGENLSELLLKAALAQEYDGGKKTSWE